MVALIKEKQLDCSMISLELTETSALVDPELGLDILARLRVKHMNVCLDDFGVGHSSLTHLYRMPFNELKLDNAFISDMRTNEDARQIVEGLIYLAHKLKMRVCAEGVEDEATFRMLEAMGCDKMQGHHFGPALPAREIQQLVANWNARFPDSDVSETA
jgi:EAL domain-containing protein (putative c-di-GMP-specific phosphodiesterase class I)